MAGVSTKVKRVLGNIGLGIAFAVIPVGIAAFFLQVTQPLVLVCVAAFSAVLGALIMCGLQSIKQIDEAQEGMDEKHDCD